MDQNLVRTDLLPPTVPTAALWAMALAGIVLWALAHHFIVRKKTPWKIRLGILVPVGFAASWMLFQLMGRLLFLAGPWHVALMAALAGASVETVSALYARECSQLPRRRGIAVVACRVAALAAVLFILLQPVMVGERINRIRRRVAVLVDDSASMNFVDKYWTLEERLEVAAAVGALSDSGLSLSGMAEEMEAVRVRFAAFAGLAEAGQGALKNAEVAADAAEAAKNVKARAETMRQIAEKLDEKELFLLKDGVGRVARHAAESVAPAFEKIAALAADEKADLRAALGECVQAAAQIAQVAPQYESAGRVVAYGALSDEAKAAALAASDSTRAAIAEKLLFEPGGRGQPLLAHLRASYDVDVFKFAVEAKSAAANTQGSAWLDAAQSAQAAQADGAASASASASDANADADANANAASATAGASGGESFDAKAAAASARVEAFRSSTDMTAAMELVLREVPSEELAGVLFISDGRHNGNAGVDAVARRLGGSGVPVSSIVIGGSTQPMDVSFAEARAPDSVFLGDKVRISGAVAATGAAGKQTTLKLMLGDKIVEEQPVFFENNDFLKEFRFTHLPDDRGVIRYRLELVEIEGEEFKNNNSWDLDVSVTDDRTNVLLVDTRPRWEFRYLRNLFYGRDKSVHLQEYLIRPDTVNGGDTAPLPAASASRKFGDSESGSFPASRDEWRKFDVIIIGDLAPEHLTSDVIEHIRYCVEERGALLVVIAGPDAMPAKISDPTWQRLLPIQYRADSSDRRRPPEESYHFRLTPNGRSHQVMAQSSSQFENEAIWNDLPDFSWRFPVEGVKPGAEVLAYAVAEGDNAVSLASLAVRDMAADPESVVRRIEEMRKKQAVNSLVVASSRGQGKVLMLNTDRTWRLRHKVGDTRHHQFWGQILRWGAGEKLRAGNQFVRVGTDKLRYLPNDEIKVFARIIGQNFSTIDGVRPRVFVRHEETGESRVASLEYRKDSNGFYEATLDAMPTPGVYALQLDAPRAKRVLAGDYPDKLETRFVVVTAEKPAEFVKITADRDIPLKLAQMTGGAVSGPADITKVWDGFGEGNRVLRERTERHLWDSWLLFMLTIACLTAEWIIRKRSGVP